MASTAPRSTRPNPATGPDGGAIRGSARPRRGDRVVAIAHVAADRIEIYGYGSYRHATTPGAGSMERLTRAVAAADRVAVPYEPMLEHLCRFRSHAHAQRTRTQFRSRREQHRSMSAEQRARALAAGGHHDRRVDLDAGGSIPADACLVMTTEAFIRYASGALVTVVPAV